MIAWLKDFFRPTDSSRTVTAHTGAGGIAVLVLVAALALSGCSYFIASATENMARDLSRAILNQDDPKTVQDGAPAYLLLIDGLIQGDPDNVNLLLAGSRLYGSYASVFVEDAQRARRLSTKARDLGARALCRIQPAACGIDQATYDPYVAALAPLTRAEVPALYALGVAWAGWIQVHRDDWNAVADVPKVEATMRRVVELDETYDHGGAHLYLGYLSTLLPPALGGKPERARMHFERAFELSGRRNLAAKVMLAERYARIVFDRPLHDRLLQEVLAADPRAPELTLGNTLAQHQARKLLASADAYF